MHIINKIKYANQIRKYWLTMFDFDRRKEIKKINFEPCSICNLKCIYCNFDHQNKRKNFMNVDLLETVLNELLNGPYNLKQLSLSQSGEVLLHPEFKELVHILKSYLDDNLKVERVVMNTNLVLLNKDIVDFLLDINVFTMISCSIDGKDKESFERLRKGANYEKCLSNFIYLAKQKVLKKNSKLEIRINNGNDKNSNKLKYDKKMIHAFDIADKVIKYNFHEWTGDIKVKGYIPSINKGFCQFMFNTVLITTDGKVAKCCNDLNGTTVYGDLKHESLLNVYHSKQRKDFLKLMYKNQRYLVKGCEKCTRV